MNILLCGYGKMGQSLERLISESNNLHLIGIIRSNSEMSDYIDKNIDVVIDFSSPKALMDWLPIFVQNKWSLISGTTGLDDNQRENLIKSSRDIAIMYESNFSVGVSIMKLLVKQLAKMTKGKAHFELTETHHKWKVDAPSGTANSIIEVLKEEDSEITVSAHSLRGGSVIGDHELQCFLDDEVISIQHKAINRNIFAQGALDCIPFITNKRQGFYSLSDTLNYD